ncbi:MAG: N-acetylmuramoyl-L-alanine amidase [Paracoccus sp. (in: a-proteobacteria)]|uniref:N-acetylmuramoyl-L-alanine amidase n=1 Tax=Paracoccus sp. TaxID=267 RepID=UPI0026E06469|nr:N-acetylmuramoyl-L-alanine amidase [Paracoccus sp. (in: a-proteobacteria)]MDO5630420.1 N-acetylmuramoyl-L-alanine amidase [Paracoccus sp. (in: a-proteobacteria)]
MRAVLLSIMLALTGIAAPAQEPAYLDAAGSAVVLGEAPGRLARWMGRAPHPPVTLRLALDRGVPWRAFLLDSPPRLVVDFRGLEFGTAQPAQVPGVAGLPDLRWGQARRDWSRVVAELPGPYRIDSAEMRTSDGTNGGALLDIALIPVSPDDFAPRASADPRMLPAPADLPPVVPAPGERPLRVMLDPGHGGFDPGAQADGQTEAALVLGFALDLSRDLAQSGVEVELTRRDDRFLSLESRMTAAREAGADLFISLHADALPQGEATGATVYVWNPSADDRAMAQLVQRHERDDLLAGVDLDGADDQLAGALMAMARADTQPRSENFAKFLTSRMALEGISLHRRPVKGAGFSVLKSPDMASVLVELGFITDATDRANLNDPVWRGRMIAAISGAVSLWAEDEAARRDLLRK